VDLRFLASKKMPKLTSALPSSEPDPALLDRLATISHGCLAVVAVFGVVTWAGWVIPGLEHILPDGWDRMKLEPAFAAVLCACSLTFSESRRSKRMHTISVVLAAAVALLGSAILLENRFHIALGVSLIFRSDAGRTASYSARMSPYAAGGFALLGITLTLSRARKNIWARVAELLIFCLCFMVLALVAGHIFSATHWFDLSTMTVTAPQTLFCLALLTTVALLQRTENGIYSIFLGRGIGGRITRILTPIILVLPFLRETARAHVLQANRMPAHYATAILASMAAMLSMVFLLFLAWRIDSMEKEIHGLSLRDELTGLYNLRGFHLLAQQSLRMAHRSNLPFSVLFIDLDDLKRINDTLGHSEGSQFLAETADILKATFRETDVIGRIGGDEFAVAGQFSNISISMAAQRMEESSALRNAAAGRALPLSFSIGFITSEEGQNESLEELLAKADQAMYFEKRRKKVPIK